MKFNPQLKHKLEEWKHASKPKPDIAHFAPTPQHSLHHSSNIKQIVATRTPVNRQTALLIAKPPWWAYAPHVKPIDKPLQPKTKLKLQKAMKPNEAYLKTTQENQENDVGASNETISRAMIGKTLSSVDATNKLLHEALDARAALDVMAQGWHPAWVEFTVTCNERLRELRQIKASIDCETRQLMVAFRDVRSFFLDKDYEKERARLADFVELCERLERLKKSGFLDQVADTILKLDSKTTGEF